MPAHVSFPVAAGTCLFYDNSIMHTSMPNTSGKDRCCLITSYKPNGGCGEVPTSGFGRPETVIWAPRTILHEFYTNPY
jgi:ectoine hydroxylase-related dioxygenase (phytanoyl-CoA dioxygenase family)